MRRTLPALLLAAPALAQEVPPLRATYSAYAGGLNVASLEIGLGISAAQYRAVTTFRTAGLLATFIRGEQTSLAEGRAGAALLPARYRMDGVWRGNARRIALDFEGGRPVLRTLEPPNEAEREPVPDPVRAGTVDTLTALAALVRQVGATGSCDLSLPTFDGRRRVDFVARSAGTERLAPNRWNSFSGQALRCEIEGRQVAGFRRDQDRARAARPQIVRAWLAPVLAGAPPVPVRLEAEAEWLGTVYVHLISVARASEAP